MLAIALALALTQTPQHRLFMQPNLPRSSLAFFEAFPASGAGTSTACSTTAPTGARGETLTYTRAGVDECYSNDGQTLTQMAANVPVVSSGSALDDVLGLWSYPAGNNLLVYSRDLSQANWTKTNMTCAKTATGMRADANSASLCTATANDATVCQTVTTASASRNSSWHLKAGTITGAVTLARDASTYSDDIAASLSSTLWRRAVSIESPGCAGGNCIVVAGLAGSVLNPQVCLKLAASGDSILIDFVQDEAGADPTTPMLSGASAGARGTPSGYFTVPAFRPYSLSAWGTVQGPKNQFAGMMSAWEDATHKVWLDQGASPATTDQAMSCYWHTAGSPSATTNNTSVAFLPPTYGDRVSYACDYDGTNSNAQIHGNTALLAGDFTPPLVTRIYFGSLEAGNQWSGVVKLGCADPVRGRCAVTAGRPGDIAMVGDSITYGATSAPTRPPLEISKVTRGVVVNLGVGGNTAAQCRSRAEAYAVGKGYSTTILMCGVNSLNSSLAAAAIWADLGAAADAVVADGQHIVLVRVTPWAGFVASADSEQVQTDALWVLQEAYCAAHPSTSTCVDTSSMGEAITDGGVGMSLKGIYDSGDGLHPNGTGAAFLGALIGAAL